MSQKSNVLFFNGTLLQLENYFRENPKLIRHCKQLRFMGHRSCLLFHFSTIERLFCRVQTGLFFAKKWALQRDKVPNSSHRGPKYWAASWLGSLLQRSNSARGNLWNFKHFPLKKVCSKKRALKNNAQKLDVFFIEYQGP